MAYQLWMPERSICASLATLDDNQLKIVNKTAHRLLFTAHYSNEENEHVDKTTFKIAFPIWYSKYRQFLECYAFYSDEEMAYRFGGEYGHKEPPASPQIYHCAYHFNNNLCCSSYMQNTIGDKEPQSINVVMRAVLSKLWDSMDCELTWTRREKPSWYKSNISIFESNGKVYGDDMIFVPNKDGTLSPTIAPILQYDWLSADRIHFVKLIW